MSELIIVKSFSVINIQDIKVETPTSSERCVQIYAKCMNWEEEGHINILTKDTFSLVCDETLEAGGHPRAVPGVAGHPYREYWWVLHSNFNISTEVGASSHRTPDSHEDEESCWEGSTEVSPLLSEVGDRSNSSRYCVCLSLHSDSFERNRNMKINVKKFLDESYGTFPHKGYRMTKKMDLGWKKSGSITNLGQKRRFL